MKNATTRNDSTTAEILTWFEDAGIAVSAVSTADCDACVTPAAA